MPEPGVTSWRCPVCGEVAVESLRNGLRFTRPSHRCAKCGSELRTKFTPRGLWAIPVAAATGLAVVVALTWLKQSTTVTGVVRAAAMGAIASLAFSIPMRFLLRSIVLRPYNDGREV